MVLKVFVLFNTSSALLAAFFVFFRLTFLERVFDGRLGSAPAMVLRDAYALPHLARCILRLRRRMDRRFPDELPFEKDRSLSSS